MNAEPWGGSEVLWSEAALRLTGSGHSVFASVESWPDRPKPVQHMIDVGIEVDEREWVYATRFESRCARLLRRPVKHPGIEPSWQSILEFKPELVCISHGSCTDGIDWMERCRVAEISYVSIAQANFEQWWPSGQGGKLASRVYSNTLRAYFVSEANRNLFERQLGQRIPNAEVVWNPYNVSYNCESEWLENDDDFKFACVGRLDPRAKGQDLIMGVLALPKWRERRISVTFYGRGSYEPELRRLAEMDGVTDKVSFAGHVEDIQEVWLKHHALLLPSRYEGLPLALVEAMLCGRPCIVTDVAGNAEVLEDNITGFVAEAPTIRHLDDAMERAWNRRHEWQTIGAAAAKAIRSKVPEEPAQDFADKLIKLVSNIIH